VANSGLPGGGNYRGRIQLGYQVRTTVEVLIQAIAQVEYELSSPKKIGNVVVGRRLIDLRTRTPGGH
jgi:hypothetical protein